MAKEKDDTYMVAIKDIEICDSPLLRHAYSTDAGFYRFVPDYVARPKNENEIIRLMEWCRHVGSHLTFRAAGTSLAGQASGSSVLVDVKRYWNQFSISDMGNSVVTQPGVVAGKVNQYLNEHGRKLGPDPASIHSCTVGGIAANNSSGMMSGINMNAYHSIKSLRFILADGIIVDTSLPDADSLLRSARPELYTGLAAIREEIINNPVMINKIREQYQVKNTIGYSLNAFLDFEKPADILSRLMIGSEGTLGFISSIEWNTCPEYINKYTGLFFFPDIKTACSSIIPIKQLGAAAVEFLDYVSLKSVENRDGVPSIIKTIPPGTAAVLFEFSEHDETALSWKRNAVNNLIKSFNLLNNSNDSFLETIGTEEREKIWKVRQGLLASLASTRDKSSTVIIEDLAFRVEDLAEAITGLSELFKSFGYARTGIYGHGLDGNVHFIIAEKFNEKSAIGNYDRFMNSLFELVVGRFNGSLKAEHGTGRNMAAFVERQWGAEAYNIMKRVKNLLDPNGILNPGVVISDNKAIHLENIKSMPEIDDCIDSCIECGFCEPVCPSRDLTLTPRQRIILRREISRNGNDSELAGAIIEDYNYHGVDTCAVDGLCAVNCPLEINTGDFIKDLRHLRNSKNSAHVAMTVARHFSAASSFLKTGIRTVHLLNKVISEKSINRLSAVLFRGKLPKWNRNIPLPPHNLYINPVNAEFLYFPCCVSRLMGKPEGTEGIIDAMEYVSLKAGLKLKIPNDINNYCCGMAFHSKGYFEAYADILNSTVRKIWEWSDEGRLPVIFDSSSCTYSFRNSRSFLNSATAEIYSMLKVLDSVEYIHDYLLPAIETAKLNETVVLHPNCSLRKMGLDTSMAAIAGQCAEKVIVPKELNCCAYAGDRGMLFPELTGSATKPEAEEVHRINGDSHYSSNIPCEIGMTGATGRDYRHIIYLVERAVKAT